MTLQREELRAGMQGGLSWGLRGSVGTSKGLAWDGLPSLQQHNHYIYVPNDQVLFV